MSNGYISCQSNFEDIKLLEEQRRQNIFQRDPKYAAIPSDVV
jgi:hypothetical protein